MDNEVSGSSVEIWIRYALTSSRQLQSMVDSGVITCCINVNRASCSCDPQRHWLLGVDILHSCLWLGFEYAVAAAINTLKVYVS